MRHRWAGTVLALVVLAAACTSGPEPDPSPDAGTGTESVVTVLDDPEVVASLGDVGEVLAGALQPAGDDVRVADAGEVPQVDGVLAAGPGMTVEGAAPPTGLVQVRLAVPPPPDDEAVPVVVRRSRAGEVTVEPALWDPPASQMVRWTADPADWWGAWIAPDHWAEEIARSGGGWLEDVPAGGASPPDCPAAPDWASVTVGEPSSVRACLRADRDDDGAERAVVEVVSDRRTPQLVTIPTDRDLARAEGVPAVYGYWATALAGADPDHNELLPGRGVAAVRFTRPATDRTVELVAYQPPRLIVLAAVQALLGELPLEHGSAALAAVTACHTERSGVPVTRIEPRPDDAPPTAEALEEQVRCAVEGMRKGDAAQAVMLELSGHLGVGGPEDVIADALRGLGPTAGRVGTALATTPSLAEVGDGVLGHGLAAGTVTVTLTGSGPATSPAEPPED